MIKMTTTKGDIVLELDNEKAPKTSENFLNYVNSGFYDGTIFHRVIKGFMIQGGGMEPGMREKATQAPIQNEADNGLVNAVGTIAMARTNDPHSATAQFFINVNNNDFLNHRAPDVNGWGYAVFGKVVDAIVAVQTGRHGMHDDVPLEDVVIEKVEVI
jgi:peptidyl-prolyl cis-trans isomerase B (cyclophilin B)